MLTPLSDLVAEYGTAKTQCKADKKKTPWHWDKVHQRAFDDNEGVIACDAVSAYPDLDETFEFYTDASTR